MASHTSVTSRLRQFLTGILVAGRANFVLALGLIVLGVNAFFAFESARVLIRYEEESKEALETLVTLEQVLSIIRDVETGARGFVITGHASYLEPYRAGIRRVDEELTQLTALIGNDTSQQPYLRKLRPDIAAKLAFTDQLIKVRMEGGFDQGRNLEQTGRGRALMDSIRVTVNEMYEIENGTFGALTLEAEQYSKQTLITLGVITVISLLLLSSVHLLAQRNLEKREQLSRILQAANEGLEARVQARTSELEQANERLRAEVMERLRAEEQLRAANDELVRSNRELEDFAYVASHDLQEPLRKIQTFASILDMDYGQNLDDEGRRYLDRLSQSANRMSRLIADLLSFSRVTSKVKPFTPTDLNEVVKTVLSDLEVPIQETQAEVHISQLPTIDADEAQMRQIFQNLIGNALKFRRADQRPVIRIEGSLSQNGQPDSWCVITVSDNGIGFDEKYLDRIFTPFQRLHNKEEYEGTGIGLSICRRIVERHGGTITAYSTPGEGATFVVTLPVHQPATTEPAPTEA